MVTNSKEYQMFAQQKYRNSAKGLQKIKEYRINNKKNQCKYSMKYSLKKIRFKNKNINVGVNPRIGVCNLCRAVVPFDCNTTHIHHEEYDENKPLANTIELCPKHHALITRVKKK